MCDDAHMDWNDLRIVLAVHRHGTLLHAAKALGVAHTTVSRRLKTLEGALGSRLFDRTPDGLRPTAAGDVLLQTAEEVEGQLLDVEGRLRGRDAELRGPLRVSSIAALLSVYPDLFQTFAERYPHVDLQIDLTGTPVSLHQRDADVLTRLSSAPPDTLVGRKVGPVTFGVYASRQLVETVGEGAPLHAFPWIGRHGGPNLRWFQDWLAQNAPGARVVLTMPYEPVHVARAVEAGIGAQLLPCFLADANPALQRIAPPDPMMRLDLWILTLPALRTSSRVHAFLEHATAYLLARRAALAPDQPSVGNP